MSEWMSDPTVQSPAGPAEDATGHWHVSLAEIDAMGRKAARGAGFSWGLAEEAGRAARWLAAFRRPGPEALLAALDAMDGSVASHAPRPDRPLWQSNASTLCPVATGAALSDRAEAIATGASFDLAPVVSPLLLVPFLCRAARDLGYMIALEGPGLTLVATPEGPATREWAPLAKPLAQDLRVHRAAEADGPAARPVPDPWRVSVDTWRALDRFAHRTYAPATEASRAGAGSGVRDND